LRCDLAGCGSSCLVAGLGSAVATIIADPDPRRQIYDDFRVEIEIDLGEN
jgi:hypothetical protein